MTITANISSASDAADAIDSAFPVAGQDNNSQGFRDNFSYTQTGLQKVVTVLTELNDTTAKNNTDNNFNGVIIENAETRRLYGSVVNNGTLSTGNTTVYVDYREGEYFTATIAANDITLSFSQWPSAAGGLYARVRIDLKNDGTTRDITWATTSGSLVYDSGLGSLYSIDGTSDTRHVFEAWTINGGNTVYLKKVGEFS